MVRFSKSFKRVGALLGFSELGSRRRRRQALQLAVMESLEQRQLMDGALELFWVQTGQASGWGVTAPTLTYQALDYEHHWVVAHSPQEAAYTLLNANTASATLTVGFTFSNYTTTTYAVGTASTNFWIVGTADEVYQGYNSTGSSSSQALVAYGGYLDSNYRGGYYNPYQISTPILAPGIANFCLPCNGIINPGPGLVNLPTSVTTTGQAQVLNDTPGGTNLASVMATGVWGTGNPGMGIPDKTVADLMGGGSSGSTDDVQLIDGDPYHTGSNSQYMAAYCGSYLEIFQGSGGVYTSTMGGSQDKLVFSGGGFVLTDADGTAFNFGGSIDGNGVGEGASTITDPAGHTTTVTHDVNGRVTQKQKAVGTNSLERTVNTYDSGNGMLSTVVVQNSSDNGSHWVTLRETDYVYYGQYDIGGPQNALAVLTVKDGSGNILDQTGYRYYTSTSGTGYTGAIKYAFGRDSMARLRDLGYHLNTAADYSYYSTDDYYLQPFADAYYEYDAQGRVTKQVVQGTGCSACTGGLGTTTYSYATSGNSGSDFNNWTNKVSETTPDGKTHIVYANGSSEPILDVVIAGGQTWVNYYRYDSSGHQTLHVNPSGMVTNGSLSYNESLADLVNYNATSGSFVSSSQGLFEWTDYYTASTATTSVVGAAAGYVKDTAVSQGKSGTKYYQSFSDYIKNTAGGQDYFHTADSVAFPQNVTSSPGTASSGARVTQYAYTWLQNGTNNTNQMASLTVTSPTVTSGNNGPGTADVSTTVFDAFGRTTWTKDADGFINYTAYDPTTGAVTKTITDVNTSQTSNFFGLPGGWASPSTASALNLITTYGTDSLGRTTKVTDPNGNVSYTIYDDVHHAVFSLSGATLSSAGTSGTLTATGPIMMSRSQLTYDYTQNYTVYSGTYSESLTFSGNLTVTVDDATNGVFEIPAADWASRGTTSDEALFNLIGNATSDSQFTIQSLSRSLTSAGSQMVESDAYFNIDNTTYLDTATGSAYSGDTSNYYATTYAYDIMGRTAVTTSPTGTISVNTYDPDGRLRGTYIGTDVIPDSNLNGMGDTDFEDFLYGVKNDPTAIPSGTNMTLVSLNQYDFGGVGDGNLTESIQFPSGGAAARATQYLYDWRDRMISTKSGISTSLPAGWNDVDIGGPYPSGSVTFDGSNFLMTGTGYGIGGVTNDWSSDYGNFAFTTVTGNTTLIARVSGQSDLYNDPQAGVMMRNATDNSSSMFAAVLVSPTEGVTFEYRSSDYYNATYSSLTGITGPVWVKLVRSTNDFSAYYSLDGSSWTQIGSPQTISMNSSVSAGIVTSSHNYGYNIPPDYPPATATAVVQDVSINGTTISSASGETDNVHRPLTVSTLDNLGEVLVSARYDGDGTPMIDADGDGVPDGLSSSALRARMSMDYDEQGRSFKTTTYSVSPTDGTYSTSSTDTMVSQSWFDHRGDTIASYTSGGPMSKMKYDGAGRVTVSYTTDGGAVGNGGAIRGTWADANSVSNDIVLSQIENTYDADGNVLLTTMRERFHDNATTGTGALLTASDTTGHAARVSFALSYYDAGNRLTESVNLGTNGGSVNGTSSGGLNLTTIPSAPTASTDTVLVTFYGYNAAGELSSVTDPRGLVTTTDYDNLGRQTAVTVNANSTDSNQKQITRYTYDGASHVLTMTADVSGNDQVTQYVYNVSDAGVGSPVVYSNDLLWLVKYPAKSGGGASSDASEQNSFTYDALGETLTKTDQNLTLHTYGYDVLGRPTSDSVSFPSGNSQNVDTAILRIDTSYNTQGLVDKITSYSNTDGASNHLVNQVQNTYNGFGQLTKQAQEHNGSVNASTLAVQYTYDTAAHGSRLISMIDPNGTASTITYSYGAANSLNDVISRLDSMSEGGTTLESYKYLGMGTVVERSHAQGTLTLTYIGSPGDAGDQYSGLDRFGRVVDQKWTAAGSTVDEYTYTYDRDSNVTSKENLGAWHAPLVHSDFYETYAYDGLNRLTSTDRYNGTASDQSWGLDALGNMTSVTTNGTVQNRTTNDENQLTNIGAATLTYDSNGNLTTDDSGYTLKYDAWNRLVSAKNGTLTLVSFAYDGQGWRTQETASGTTTDQYYTSGWQIAETRVSVSYGNAGTVQSQNVWSPVYVNALVLRDRDTDANGSLDERLYFTSDANFDVTSALNTSGAVQEHMVYTSYGNVAFKDASWSGTSDSKSLRTLWQGGNWNSWINSYDFQRRFYSPSLMRWTTMDPAGYADGMNRYWAMRNNVIGLVDPYGLDGTTTQPATQPAISVKASQTQTTGPVTNTTAYALTLQYGGQGPGQFQLSLVGTQTTNNITHEDNLSFSTSATVPVTSQVSLNATGGYDPAKGTNVALGNTLFLSDKYQLTLQGGDTINKGISNLQGMGSLKIQLLPGGNGQPSISVTPQLKGNFNLGNNSYSISPSLRLDEKFSDTFSIFLMLGGTCNNGPSQKDRDFVGTYGGGAAIKFNLDGFKFEFDPSFQVNKSGNRSKDNMMFSAALVFPF